MCSTPSTRLIDDEFLTFCEGKDAVLVVEEGQPNYIEQAFAAMLHKAGRGTRLVGKEHLPMAGEYTGQVMLDGLGSFLRAEAPFLLSSEIRAPNKTGQGEEIPDLSQVVPGRPPGFCIGCPERPIFAATKLVEQELGKHHIASDIGCHLFSIMPPFELGATTMGYGLGPASASAFNSPDAKRRSISFVGDGGFWHNGLTSSIGNAVFNKNDGVIVIVDNFYSAATGGQDILSSRAGNRTKSTKHPITEAVKGMGVKWLRHIDRTYDVGKMQDTLKEALTTDEKGPKVIVASSECMLNKPAPRETAGRQGDQGRRARGEAEIRRRRGHLHRRPRLHAALRLPLAVGEVARRSAARRSGRPYRPELRRLRQLRRGGGCRRALPVLLPRRCRPQSGPLGPLPRNACAARVIGFLQRRRESRRLNFADA